MIKFISDIEYYDIVLNLVAKIRRTLLKLSSLT